MAQNESVSSNDKPPERKLSNGFAPPENRLRTKSFGEKGTTHVVREYVGDGMDRMLFEKGMVKKAIPRDNTSIFRAVCEQISSVQTDYNDLRMLVEQLLPPMTRRHYKDTPSSLYDRDKDIFEILADITCSRIIVYRAASDEPTVFEGPVVEEGREIKVCESQYRGVYEPVYSDAMHESLAISQSIVYRILYEDVFKLPKELIDEEIEYIRLDIDKHSRSTLDEMFMMSDNHMHAVNAPCSKKGGGPKLPFCACKSLDPAIYRNIEYDLYRAKMKENEQAQKNSLAVKFGVGARCLAREGGAIRQARVTMVVKHDVRRIVFEDGSNITREFEVSDLRPLPGATVAHHTMQSLLHVTGPAGGGGGGGPPHHSMPYLPGCFPPPQMFNMPPPTTSSGMFMGGPPPPHHWPHPPPFSPPPFMMTQQSGRQMPPPFHPPPPPYSAPPAHMMMQQGPQQNFAYGSNEMMMMPPPPPTPAGREMSMDFSPAPADCSLNNSSVFTATPLSSRKGDEGRRNKNKKQRVMSIELADSPTTRPKKTDAQRGQAAEKEDQTGRRATEGDAVGEMNRPLQPKQRPQEEHLSTRSNLPENDSLAAGLPSVEQLRPQQMVQLQVQNGGKAAAAAYRAKLPSLLPMPPAQARASYYDSSTEWTGDDTVFTADEGEASQMSLSNNHDSPLISYSSANETSLEGAVAAKDLCTTSCPFISADDYHAVNKGANYSVDPKGSDLPDTLTNRFFYNLGVQIFRNQINCGEVDIRPPPPDAIPMPPMFLAPSPSIPPNSPFFPGNGPFTMLQTSAAPPNTPALYIPASVPSHLAQYYHPRVDGMPPYGYMVDDGRGAQMMNQGPVTTMPSPSPMMQVSQANFFFPNN